MLLFKFCLAACFDLIFPGQNSKYNSKTIERRAIIGRSKGDTNLYTVLVI